LAQYFWMPIKSSKQPSRRNFLKESALAASLPIFVPSSAFGANERINFAGIGMGGRGRGDMNSFLGFSEIQTLAVCDVVQSHADQAKTAVDRRYGNSDCKTYVDYREIITRDDIDAILIATPDHWHAKIAIEAMMSGKDVFCEKPETLTIREGQMMRDTARRFGRVFSGGSQRVWGDYNWFHRMIYGGAIGEVKEAWVNVGGPSAECYLPEEPLPNGVDWNRWLGPAPWRPYHPALTRGGFRPFRDYSGGGMTDWGCHGFGGALFALNLHETGPVKITPPDGKDIKHLTYEFSNGIKIYHGGGWGGILSFKGTENEIPFRNNSKNRTNPPSVYIPNYKGQGGLSGDFIHCVKSREKPFRDIERAHRTATHCHLGNIAYWLKREIKWDPDKEEIIGDPEASRWIDRPKREPFTIG